MMGTCIEIDIAPEAQALDVLRIKNVIAHYQYECEKEVYVKEQTQFSDYTDFLRISISFNKRENIALINMWMARLQKLQFVQKVSVQEDRR